MRRSSETAEFPPAMPVFPVFPMLRVSAGFLRIPVCSGLAPATKLLHERDVAMVTILQEGVPKQLADAYQALLRHAQARSATG